MEIKVTVGDILKAKSSCIILNHYEDNELLEDQLQSLDRILDGAISTLVGLGEIKGKLGEVNLIHSLGKLPSTKVAVAGLGKKTEINTYKISRAVAEACRVIRQKSNGAIDSIIQGQIVIDGLNDKDIAQAITEGILLGTYSFRKYITKDTEIKDIKVFNIMLSANANLPDYERGILKGMSIAEATNLARDIANEPSNYMTPTDMANTATKLAKTYNLDIEVIEREEMYKLGMGGLLGVSQGSQQPSKFIILKYKGNETAEIDIALVGKGITFDSGGISIKPSEKMDEMKGDKAGAASVIASMTAIAQLKPKINVMALVPATENLPGGTAMKPGDIITAMNGKTIEIISTDAEGRLILADALSYAVRNKAHRIIDVATLTGACHVALGDHCTGAFGNNQELIDQVVASGKAVGECMWQMPMMEEYKEPNKSDVADIKNSGGRYGGAITAAQFLAEFVGDTPWVHLDIAGTFLTEKDFGVLVKGATGVAVRTMIHLVLALNK